MQEPLKSCAEQFENASTYGSLIDVEMNEDIDTAIEEFGGVLGFNADDLEKMMRVYKILGQKYDVVVTNPPYMGASNMNSVLSDFIKKNYSDYKSDFFSAFVVRCSKMAKPTGRLGFLTPYVWMFIQSYEKMRKFLYSKTIDTLIQFEYSAFEEPTVPICTFTFSNNYINKKGCYVRLTDFRGGMEVQRQKTLQAISDHSCGYYFEQSTDNFEKIPGSPVAYWVSEAFFKAFENRKIGDVAKPCKGIDTGDNNRFLRFWFEIYNDRMLYPKDDELNRLDFEKMVSI